MINSYFPKKEGNGGNPINAKIKMVNIINNDLFLRITDQSLVFSFLMIPDNQNKPAFAR